MEPVILALENKYGDQIDFIIADVDKEQELSARYQVYSIPAFFFIGKNGTTLDTNVGYIPQDKLEKQINDFLAKNKER